MEVSVSTLYYRNCLPYCLLLEHYVLLSLATAILRIVLLAYLVSLIVYNKRRITAAYPWWYA